MLWADCHRHSGHCGAASSALLGLTAARLGLPRAPAAAVFGHLRGAAAHIGRYWWAPSSGRRDAALSAATRITPISPRERRRAPSSGRCALATATPTAPQQPLDSWEPLWLFKSPFFTPSPGWPSSWGWCCPGSGPLQGHRVPSFSLPRATAAEIGPPSGHCGADRAPSAFYDAQPPPSVYCGRLGAPAIGLLLSNIRPHLGCCGTDALHPLRHPQPLVGVTEAFPHPHFAAEAMEWASPPFSPPLPFSSQVHFGTPHWASVMLMGYYGSTCGVNAPQSRPLQPPFG